MKVFILLLLVCAKAIACPNLAGNYSCKNENETLPLTITQDQENGATVFHQVKGEDQMDYTADGVAKPYTVNTQGRVIDGTISATCSDSLVNVKFLAKYEGMDIDYSETIELKDGNLQFKELTTVGGEEFNSALYKCSPII